MSEQTENEPANLDGEIHLRCAADLIRQIGGNPDREREIIKAQMVQPGTSNDPPGTAKDGQVEESDEH